MIDNLTRIAVLMIGRKTFFDPRLDRPNTEYSYDPPLESTIAQESTNLVGSLVDDTPSDNEEWLHAPVLDLDYTAHLIPSSTPGNYHLYLDKTITWKQYKKVLKVLAHAGLIEPGYAKAAIRKKGSYVRLPGVKKKKHWFSSDHDRPMEDWSDWCACGKPKDDRVHIDNEYEHLESTP